MIMAPTLSERRSGFNLGLLKGHNTALVMAALRDAGEEGLAQSRLAVSTNLTPQAISKIVGRLSRAGLVESAGRGVSTGGKRPTLLKLQAVSRRAVGIQLDRRETTFVLDNLTGTELRRCTVPIGLVDPVDEVLQVIEMELRNLLSTDSDAELPTEGLLGIGLACPGPLDQTSGVLLEVRHHPHWHNFHLREALLGLGYPEVIIIKDTDAAARAAFDLGGAAENHVHVHFGTGLGAGLILGGAVYQARNPYANEFGHQVVMQTDGPACDCGRDGCLEAVCLQAVAQGRPDEAARQLALAIANLDRLLGLDAVTLGGQTVEDAPEMFMTAVVAALDSVSPRSHVDRVRTINFDAELMAHGAAAQVLDTIFG